MTTNLNALQWQDSCVPGTAQWVETPAANGGWLLIMKRTLGGYGVTQFDADKKLTVSEVEMSADEVAALLAPA